MIEAFNNRNSALVIVGAFAPAMFHPSWFLRYELLGKSEVAIANKSENLVISNEITLFSIAGFDFDIRPNKIQISTNQESLFESTRDLVCSILDVLDGAPVEQIGMNWTVHYSTPSVSAWHAAGDKLVPKKNFWSKVWPKHVGMSNLSLQFERTDKEEGIVNIVFQPSGLIKHGVFVSINDHYQLKCSDEKVYSADAAKFIRSKWKFSKDMAEKMFHDIYTETTNA